MGGTLATTVILEPTVSAIWFATVRNPLKCTRVRKRIRVPAHYSYVRRHHHLVRVRVRAHDRYAKVRQCHARTVTRRVAYWVTVKRHGHRVRVKRYRYVRSVVFPSQGHATVRHVRAGTAVTLQGWLGTTWLAPMAGFPVIVCGAVDNGQGNFQPAYPFTPGTSRKVYVTVGG